MHYPTLPRLGSTLIALALLAAPSFAQSLSAVHRAPPDALARARSNCGAHTLDGDLVAAGDRWSARFFSGSVTITPALGAAAERPMPLRWSLESIRRGEFVLLESSKDRSVAPELDAQTVRYQHQVGIAETYTVRPEGLKQDFHFATRPAGSGDLVVRLRLDTDLQLAEADRTAVWTLDGTPDTSGIQLGAVVGIDAEGTRADGAMRIDGSHLELTLPGAFVESASYPLVLDPLIGARITLADRAVRETDPDVAYDATQDLFFFVWQEEFATGNYDIRGQFVRPDGALQGPSVVLTAYGEDERSPSVCRLAGRFVIAWESNPFGSWDTWGRTVAWVNGQVSLGPTFSIAGGTNNQRFPVLCGSRGSDDFALAVYQDDARGIVAQIISSARLRLGTQGTPGPSLGWANPGANRPSVCRSLNTPTSDRTMVVWQGAGGAILLCGLQVREASLTLSNPPQVLVGASVGGSELSIDGDGERFLCAYKRPSGTLGTDVYTHHLRFGDNGGFGRLSEGWLQLNPHDQGQPAVGMIRPSPDPAYCIAYYNQGQGGGDESINAAVVIADGTRCDIRTVDSLPYVLGGPSVGPRFAGGAPATDDHAAITYHGWGGNSLLWDIFAQRWEAFPGNADSINEPAASFDATPSAAGGASNAQPITVQFTDTSTNTPTSWSWDLDGDGVYGDSTARNPQSTYRAAKIWTIGLRASNACGTGETTWELDTRFPGLEIVGPEGWPQFGDAVAAASAGDTIRLDVDVPHISTQRHPSPELPSDVTIRSNPQGPKRSIRLADELAQPKPWLIRGGVTFDRVRMDLIDPPWTIRTPPGPLEISAGGSTVRFVDVDIIQNVIILASGQYQFLVRIDANAVELVRTTIQAGPAGALPLSLRDVQGAGALRVRSDSLWLEDVQLKAGDTPQVFAPSPALGSGGTALDAQTTSTTMLRCALSDGNGGWGSDRPDDPRSTRIDTSVAGRSTLGTLTSATGSTLRHGLDGSDPRVPGSYGVTVPIVPGERNQFGRSCRRTIRIFYDSVQDVADAFVSNYGTDLGAVDGQLTGVQTLGFTADIAFRPQSSIEIDPRGRILAVGGRSELPSVMELSESPVEMICPLWADLRTGANGKVWFRRDPGSVTVTWDRMEFRGNEVTFQATLHADSSVTITWVDTTQFLPDGLGYSWAIVGVSPGNVVTVPSESDFSDPFSNAGVIFFEAWGWEPLDLQMTLQSNVPTPGSAWDLTVSALPRNTTFGIVSLGIVNPDVDLDLIPALGLPGCWQHVTSIVDYPVTVSRTQPNVFSYTLPHNTGLTGLRLFAQAATVSPGATPLGLALSNGVEVVIGY